MNPTKINLFITPEIAGSLVKLYFNLMTDRIGNAQEITDLELRFKEIADFNKWEYKEVQEIIDRLSFISFQEDGQELTAAVPPNLEELVDTYVKYEAQLAQPKTNQVQEQINQYKQTLEKQRELISRLSPQQVVSTEKLINVQSGEVYTQKESSVATIEKPTPQVEDTTSKVPENTRRVLPPIPPQEQEKQDGQIQEAQEPKRDQIENWVEQARQAVRVQRMVDALEKANIPKEYAQPIAEKIASRTNVQGERDSVIDEIQFSQTVSEAIKEQDAKNKEQLIPQSQEFIDTIASQAKKELPEIQSILQSNPDVDTQNAPFDLSSSFTRPQNKPRFSEVSTDETKEGLSLDEERRQKREKIDTDNLTLVLYKRKEFWRDPFRIFYSNKDQAREYVIKSIQQIQINNPELYNKNFILFKKMEAHIDEIVANLPGGKYESLDIVPIQNALEEIQKYGVVGTQVLQIYSQDENEILKVNEISYKEAQRIADSHRESSNFVPDVIKKSVNDQLVTTSKNWASRVGIITKNLYTNKNLGLARFTMGGALGGLSFFLPAPLNLVAFGSSASLFLAQLQFTPVNTGSALNFAINNADVFSKIPSLDSVLKTPRKIWALNGTRILLIALPIAITIYSYQFLVNQTQSIFLPEKTSSALNIESKYITLSKMANPSSYSGDLPTDIEFTISIGAKDKALKDISVSDNMSVYSKTTPNAPKLPEGVTFPTSIEAGKSQTITFKIPIGPEYKDSILTNTVAIKANVQDGPNGETSTKTVTVTIGNPPTGCFVFDGTWPDNYKAIAQASFSKLSAFPVYLSNICKNSSFGPNVTVRYGGGARDYGGEVNGGNIITLYNRTFDSSNGRDSCAFYTIAHESGHVFANKNPEILAGFLKAVNPPSGESYIPSYTLGFSPSEDFAEAISMYIKHNISDFGCSGRYDVRNMPSVSPIHYNFFSSYIK